jgi:putative restriction endonuclease
MRGLVLPTDYDWYSFLKARPLVDEVNFWQPSGATTFHTSAPGTPVFFKLKVPHSAIAGFGFLARASVLPAWLAWDSFGQNNGAASFEQMVQRIEKYRDIQRRDRAGRYEIGCLMISDPVFFPESDWVAQPADWKGQTVQGRGEDLTRGEGARILQECLERRGLGDRPFVREKLPWAAAPPERFGSPVLIAPRLGQGTFRIAVTDAYARACAVTKEHSLPALEAAHIQPYGQEGSHAVSNGLLLRSDVHRLFDKGYVTVNSDLRFEVSDRLREDFDNGRSYYPLRGQPISLPEHEQDRPGVEALDWHRQNVFLG